MERKRKENDMLKCSCGRGLNIPTYPHKDNFYDVCFPTDEVVVVTIKCECGKYLTTTYSLIKIETIEE